MERNSSRFRCAEVRRWRREVPDPFRSPGATFKCFSHASQGRLEGAREDSGQAKGAKVTMCLACRGNFRPTHTHTPGAAQTFGGIYCCCRASGLKIGGEGSFNFGAWLELNGGNLKGEQTVPNTRRTGWRFLRNREKGQRLPDAAPSLISEHNNLS